MLTTLKEYTGSILLTFLKEYTVNLLVTVYD